MGQYQFSCQAIDDLDVTFGHQLLNHTYQALGAEPEGQFLTFCCGIIHPGDTVAGQVVKIVLDAVVLGDDEHMVALLPHGVDNGAGIGPHACGILGGNKQYVSRRVSHEVTVESDGCSCSSSCSSCSSRADISRSR